MRRNHRYATIVCDLKRRQIVTLLPDRESATVEAWLSDHPEIRTLARDRGGGYGEAAAKAAPHVLQVADRWHLMENASAAFLIAVRKSMSAIRCALCTTKIDPDLLTRAERLQYEGYLRREEANAAIIGLSKEGLAIKEIVRRTGHSRGRHLIGLPGGRLQSSICRWRDVLRGTMDVVSSLGLLYRSRPIATRTRVRLNHLILLIPCWEGRGAHPELHHEASRPRKGP